MSQEASETPDLRSALETAATDEPSTDDLLAVVNAFIQTETYLPAVSPPAEDGSVSPLVLQDEEANPVLPLFSSREIPTEYAEKAPHVAAVSGIGVLQSVTDAGIVIDPGSEHQFAMSQDQLAAIREQVTAPGEQ